MSYLNREQLLSIGFKSIGQNVKISDMARFYNPGKISIGNNVRIDDFCIVSGNVSLGNNIHLAVYSYITGCDAGVVMEDFSGLAYGVKVFTDSDDYSGVSLTNPTVPDDYKPKKISKPVLIKKHVIIGANSIVLPGVVLGEGCAIGACSMVTKSTKEWRIYSGIPARDLKARKKDLLKLEAEYLEAKHNDIN
ncbi:TPA: acyltransferase [Vibrio alginolyticus]|uniref:acyltransferase n=1 Tax=Vibrio TaxID=662 RepID=UPI00084A4CEC|nr:MULTISPECIES: acyltransferase [Vibrio]ELA9203024.1 acyltransferase [Vibrio alginolyticus]MDW2258591.1 acyltransferase [Vibrio sp. 1409]EGQ9595723.1 acyltransferase [Vibrio parahaemolyticus]EHK9125921.1 acyltransferase [Vibrio parahaemolyticus]EHU4888623.1 acyltransferase [Vibrio parahaemolyticus]